MQFKKTIVSVLGTLSLYAHQTHGETSQPQSIQTYLTYIFADVNDTCSLNHSSSIDSSELQIKNVYLVQNTEPLEVMPIKLGFGSLFIMYEVLVERLPEPRQRSLFDKQSYTKINYIHQPLNWDTTEMSQAIW